MNPDASSPATAPHPVRIHLDLSGHEHYFTLEVERLFETISSFPVTDGVLADRRETADCVLRIGGCPSLREPVARCLHWEEDKSPREFVWDMGDLPTGGRPGFYSSLPGYMHDRRRHRAFCLPIKCNEVIEPYDLNEATFLYGFFGAVSSGVRARMVPMLRAQNAPAKGLIEVRDSIWDRMFDRSGLQAKRDYADALRRSRFNLCPRGSVLAGVGSRLFETLQAARVPVIISDWTVLPEGIDWEACAVRIRERDMARIPRILESYRDRWPEMALSARRVWEAHFSEQALLGEMGRQLRQLLAWKGEAKFSTRLNGRSRIALGLMSWKSRQALAAFIRWRLRKK